MRTLSILAAVIGLALLATSVADAHRMKYRTTAKLLSGGAAGAKGKVGCTTRGCPPKCKAGRKVTLFRVSDLPGAKDQKFGTARTRLNGTFTVKASLIEGSYYVVVARLVFVANAAHRHWCAAAASPRVQF